MITLVTKQNIDKLDFSIDIGSGGISVSFICCLLYSVPGICRQPAVLNDFHHSSWNNQEVGICILLKKLILED